MGLCACENAVETRPNVLPSADAPASADVPDVGTEADSPGSDLGAPELPGDVTAAAECSCLAVGQWYRFTKLKLLTLDGGDHPVIVVLNPLWATDIKHNELNFFFGVTAASDTHVTFNVVNAARTDDKGGMCMLDVDSGLDTTVVLEMPRAGCALQKSSKAGINVYAGTTVNTKNCAPDLPVKHAIPVRNAELEGTLKSDCSGIIEGKVLSGSFSKAALGKICTCLTVGAQRAEECGVPDPKYTPDPNGSDDPLCGGCNSKYQNLMTLLNAFGDLQYTCLSEDGGPAVCLTAEFTAERVLDPPKSCPK